MPTTHRSIQDGTSTLPTSSGDRDVEIEFAAPGLSSTTSLHARPFLSYRMTPESEDVRVVIELNNVEVVDETFRSGVSRQLSEIFDHGILQSSGNTLRVFVPNDESGTANVSDLVVTYTSA